MELFAEIKEMIVRELALDEGEVRPEVHLQDDLGADSLCLLNLAELMSEKYGIPVEADDLANLDKVGELVELIQSRIAAGS